MDLELRIKEEPDWLEETGNILLVPTGNIAESRTSAASYVTDPEQLRVYMETITQSVAAKTEHADPALPALMVYHREGKDRIEETCTIFNYLSKFTEHGAQDPVELTEAVLPWAFIIRPENQSWFRCYERNLSRDFQVVRLPGKGTRAEDNNRQDAATQTLREEKVMSNASTQTARRQRHKQVSTDSYPPAVMEPTTAMTGMDGSVEVETDAPWSSETVTQASWPVTASYTVQTDAANQHEEVGAVAGHILPSRSPGWEEGHFQDELCADVKKEVDMETPAIDEFTVYIKEENNFAGLTEDPLHSCDVPSKTCSPISNLQTDNDDLPYSCTECNSRFALKGTLKAHMLTHSGQIPYCCPVCSRMFPTNSNLKNHMLTHSGERPHKCTVCNACFALKGTLKGHMLTHSANKPYQCSVCNKSFALKTPLKTHMLTHSGDKPHACSLCSRRFVFKSLLKNHLLTHSGIRPYSCSICNMGFSEKSQLKKHMFTHSGSKPYACNECNCKFSRKYSLVSHMVTHSEEKPFFCSVCNNSFARKNYFKKHMLLHSGKGRVCCNVCDRTFSKKCYLKKHMLIHSEDKVK